MTQLPNLQGPETPTHSADDGELFDWSALRRWVGFVLRSVPRHKVVAVLTVLVMLALTGVAAKWAPRKYQSEARLLANRNQMMALLGNPHRNMPTDQDAPTRAATETVMTRDNLESMISQTQLLEHWQATRNPLLRFKDKLFELVFGPNSDDEKMEIMLQTLEKRLNVFAVDQTVVIRIEWPDAQMARHLVETAQQNFLEARHVQEVSAISEAISILEMHAAETQTGIEEAIKQVQAVAEERKKGVKAPVAPRVPRPAVNNNEVPAQELAQLKFLIRTKRRSISDLEDFRTRRLTEMQAQAAEQRVIYSANHPTVVDMEQRIAAMQKESPQVLQLKRDEESLVQEYKTRGGRDVINLSDMGGPAPVRGSITTGTDLDAALGPLSGPEDDPAMLVARDQLRMATARYQDLLMRIDAARIELDTARAAFKYRYSVVSPALTPRQPVSPNVLLIILGGVFGAIALAFFASTLLDLKGGRLIEAWQVESQLGIPVLAELKTRKLS